MIKKILLKRKLSKLGYPFIPITSTALNDYRTRVRGNLHESDWVLQKKLNRNFYMGVVDEERSDDRILHKKFGALTIIYRLDTNVIVGVTNHKHGWYGCEIDKEMKNKMNKIYGLD
jgi:hypothetical protein